MFIQEIIKLIGRFQHMFTTVEQAIVQLQRFPSKQRIFVASTKSERWIIHEAARRCGMTHRSIVNYEQPHFRFKTTVYYRDGRIVPAVDTRSNWFHGDSSIDHLEVTGWLEPFTAVEVGFRSSSKTINDEHEHEPESEPKSEPTDDKLVFGNSDKFPSDVLSVLFEVSFEGGSIARLISGPDAGKIVGVSPRQVAKRCIEPVLMKSFNTLSAIPVS